MRRSIGQQGATARLLDLLEQDSPGLPDALAAAGLPEQAALTPVAARIEGGPGVWAAAALAEALARTEVPFAAAPDGRDGAAALVAAPAAAVAAALRAAWPDLRRNLTKRQVLRAGVGPTVRPSDRPARRCAAAWSRPGTRWSRSPARRSAAVRNWGHWPRCCAASRTRSPRRSTGGCSARWPRTTGPTRSPCWTPSAPSWRTTAPGRAPPRRCTST
ncbi:hypothetical protein [Kitasatospora sp. NPDC059571]|uniref:hypothetical protein n=1 Tax=Kitasatospora sp. NPDC059571 TaxID=3346871 RepID=UPI0036D1AC7C